MDLEIIRHSLAHIMASAVLELKPKTKLTIGPAIENGFYYDFDFNGETITADDFKEIEKKMKKIIRQKLPFERSQKSIEDAISFYKEQGNHYKAELIEGLKEKGETTVSFYKMGNFIDLCRGPHLNNTGEVSEDIFSLDKLAGAYWRGDEKREMLTRIYALAFATKEELIEFKRVREEALKRDHRKLGAELELFSSHDEIGQGLTCWKPKGAKIRALIEEFWRKEHFKNGYDMVYTPHIGKSTLWEISGHLDCYSENMYAPMIIDEQKYYIKPMNCPFHIMIYKDAKHSYRDLPVRYAEMGTVYRYEKSGVLHGLMRVRGFTQDDAHIICTPEQVEEEIKKVLRFSLQIWSVFGFKEIKAYVATRPAKAVGHDDKWQTATNSIIEAVKAENVAYQMDEGGGAFYGPKIDLKVKDALNREWQMSTIQFDWNLPERFDMTFVDKDGEARRPFMIHRALLGSLERFFGVITEHYAGAFPLWIAPTQVKLLAVADRHIDYVKQIEEKLKENDIRVELDVRAESIGKKIRDGRMERIPYLCVIGDQEVENKTVTARNRDSQEQKTLTIDDFINAVNKGVVTKELTLSI